MVKRAVETNRTKPNILGEYPISHSKRYLN